MRILILTILCIFIAGCILRTYTIQRPRTDLEIQGNQGYLVGEPPPREKELKKTRPVTVFEIELGTHQPQEVQEPQEPVSSLLEEGSAESPTMENFLEEEPTEDLEVSSQESLQESPSPTEYRMYTVGKNDTLQKISKKFYGTTRKWKFLYEFNKDVIKNPDEIYPGLKIKIPKL